jgi:hypothetical protein
MRVTIVSALASVVILTPVLVSAGHVELEKKDVKCQTAIGVETRRFVDMRHEALVACENDGADCNLARRDRAVERARDRLATVLARRCGSVDLSVLHFPSACPDPDGAEFSVDNLVTCIVEAHESRIDRILAAAQGAQGDHGHPRRCARTIRRQAETFVQRVLRARTRCLDLQVKDKLPPFPDLDCRAEYPVGEHKTDRLISLATRRLHDALRRRCGGVDLVALGFPGTCPPGANGFALEDLQHCILTVTNDSIDEMIDVTFPAPTPTPTFSPTPAATPTPPDEPM